ncbi:MAG: hypothetical protein RL018_1222 [Pseudomonadota bacterium]
MGFFRKRFQHWFEARLPLTDSMLLNQRNVYILPTKAGWMMVLTLLVLLVASINYQLNLGYLLTFLIGGSVIIGMHIGHANLRGIAINIIASKAHFASDNVNFELVLSSTRKSQRHGIGVSVLNLSRWTWVDVPAQGSVNLQIASEPMQRGKHRLPTLTLETRFPMGIFRVWTVIRPAMHVWVYPAVETNAPALPAGEPLAGDAKQALVKATGEFDGVRTYRRGDPVKHIVWKKLAKTWSSMDADDPGSPIDLISRDTQHATAQELWLDFSLTSCTGVEASLSRLCAWVVQAESLGLVYGLRLPQIEIQPASGESHKQQCLQTLALY